jgi:HEAT repeat protein
MKRRRRFDSWREWEQGVRYIRVRAEGDPAAWRGARRQALLWLAALAVSGLVVYALAARSVFDASSAAAWEAGITSGDVADRAERLLQLGESPMLAKVPCEILVSSLADSEAVRNAAVPTLAVALRHGRCADLVEGALARDVDPRARVAAARALGRAGATVVSHAIPPLLDAVAARNTAVGAGAVRAAAVAALAALDDSSGAVLDGVERAFRDGPAEVRVEALDALLHLRLPSQRLAQLATIALNDHDQTVRLTAVSVLESLGVRRELSDADLTRLVSALRDPAQDVRLSIVRALGHIGGGADAVVVGLFRAARQDRSGAVRDAAAQALGDMLRKAR